MRPGFLNTCLVSLYFLIASAASPRDKYRDPNEHLPEVVKSVSPDLSKEPSCDELRAMWRFSKRQSRAAESTNEIPTYRDPFAYNVWEEHASIRSVGGGKIRRPLVYGRLVHNIQRPRIHTEENTPERIRAFEEVARLFGTSVHIPKVHSRRKPTSIRLVGGTNGLTHTHLNNAQTGSFQHLKELIQSERARELHEQKMSEENAAREQYQRMMIQDQTGLVPYGQRERDDLNFKTGRSRGQLEGVINFPDVLAPSKYENDLYTNLNYMQRSYPDPLSVPEFWSPNPTGIAVALPPSLQPLPPLTVQTRKRPDPSEFPEALVQENPDNLEQRDIQLPMDPIFRAEYLSQLSALSRSAQRGLWHYGETGKVKENNDGKEDTTTKTPKEALKLRRQHIDGDRKEEREETQVNDKQNGEYQLENYYRREKEENSEGIQFNNYRVVERQDCYKMFGQKDKCKEARVNGRQDVVEQTTHDMTNQNNNMKRIQINTPTELSYYQRNDGMTDQINEREYVRVNDQRNFDIPEQKNKHGINIKSRNTSQIMKFEENKVNQVRTNSHKTINVSDSDKMGKFKRNQNIVQLNEESRNARFCDLIKKTKLNENDRKKCLNRELQVNLGSYTKKAFKVPHENGKKQEILLQKNMQLLQGLQGRQQLHELNIMDEIERLNSFEVSDLLKKIKELFIKIKNGKQFLQQESLNLFIDQLEKERKQEKDEQRIMERGRKVIPQQATLWLDQMQTTKDLWKKRNKQGVTSQEQVKRSQAQHNLGRSVQQEMEDPRTILKNKIMLSQHGRQRMQEYLIPKDLQQIKYLLAVKRDKDVLPLKGLEELLGHLGPRASQETKNPWILRDDRKMLPHEELEGFQVPQVREHPQILQKDQSQNVLEVLPIKQGMPHMNSIQKRQRVSRDLNSK